jgi:succinate-semialdehyde dehydrogenase/glutarate-semialdehyde dehydrogenase
MILMKDPSLFQQQAFIDGEFCDADDGGTVTVTNPASGAVLGTVPDMGAAETARAIAAADAAWAGWKAKPAKARAAVLRAWYDLILANADDLALLMTLEQGKPIKEAQGRRRAAIAVDGPPHRRHEGARGRMRRDHAVELPGRDDHP